MLAIDRSFAPLRTGLANSTLLRAMALPLLRRCDFEFTIRNPHADMRLRLLSYTHKGYWYYGAAREAATLKRMKNLIKTGDTILEAGGHIGYLTQFLSRLSGPSGKVHVFEPGLQNAAFLRKNTATCANVTQSAAAVSDHTGFAAFYEENIGGFMNSLDAEFVRHSDQGRARKRQLQVREHLVPVTRIDDYRAANDLCPAFLKIDVEGAELAALRGAEHTLHSVRSMMIEVTRDQADVYALLKDHGFDLSTADGQAIHDTTSMHGNIFAQRPHLTAKG